MSIPSAIAHGAALGTGIAMGRILYEEDECPCSELRILRKECKRLRKRVRELNTEISKMKLKPAYYREGI